MGDVWVWVSVWLQTWVLDVIQPAGSFIPSSLHVALIINPVCRVSSVFFHSSLHETTGLLWKQPDDSSINHSRSHDTGIYVNWPCHDAHTPSWRFSWVPSLFLPHFWGHLLSAMFIYGLCFWPWAVKLSMTATWLEDKTYGPMEFKCLVALRVKLRKQRKNNQINSDWSIKLKKISQWCSLTSKCLFSSSAKLS